MRPLSDVDEEINRAASMGRLVTHTGMNVLDDVTRHSTGGLVMDVAGFLVDLLVK